MPFVKAFDFYGHYRTSALKWLDVNPDPGFFKNPSQFSNAL